MKKLLCAFLAAGLLTSAVTTNALAASFAGSAGVTYASVSSTTRKSNTSYNSKVTWNTSDKSSHKMWFAVYDGGSQKGSLLLSYKQSTSFRTNGTSGMGYKLSAKREHIGNPTTYVTGTWIP